MTETSLGPEHPGLATTLDGRADVLNNQVRTVRGLPDGSHYHHVSANLARSWLPASSHLASGCFVQYRVSRKRRILSVLLEPTLERIP